MWGNSVQKTSCHMCGHLVPYIFLSARLLVNYAVRFDYAICRLTAILNVTRTSNVPITHPDLGASGHMDSHVVTYWHIRKSTGGPIVQFIILFV
eukprot:2170667-Amphidinium_carterae.3